MPTARGTITSQNGTRFIATFIINEIQYIYAGSVAPNPGPYRVYKATLTYNNIEDLTAIRSLTGKIGIYALKLTLDNRVTMEGDLPDDGLLDPATTVSGSGTWTTA